MSLSRREFLKLISSLVGGWAFSVGPGALVGNFSTDMGDSSSQILFDAGYFPDRTHIRFRFDEHKYSPLKRELERSDWKATNRHLPIKLAPDIINLPSERSPEALRRVVDFTGFNHPRYVASPGERVTMCNIAAWDWSRALRVHLPHWKGETEMSANMLYRWISHTQAGGIYGEGWQPVQALPAQLLANRGIPVFALVENPTPGRHGHVAMVYPKRLRFPLNQDRFQPDFASVRSGRSGRGNGIMSLSGTFRSFKPTYFVHRDDFIVHPRQEIA